MLAVVNIGDYGKGEFGNKKHEHIFLDLVKSLDEVEGIERLNVAWAFSKKASCFL